MEQFKIEIANEGLGYFYDIKSLGNRLYEIYDREVKVGIIEIDGEDHEHCRTVDCEIDLPLMNAIREGIVLHEHMNQRPK
ncbi:hypothetical protein [Pedobacter immunditicola]|uniref:hypothetical protein n=1 Tax=Pedobacter immunditicola TaxID=3133440 RepID=UPI0030AD474F